MGKFKEYLLNEQQKIKHRKNYQIKFDLSTIGRNDWDKEILSNKDDFVIKLSYMSPDEFLDKTDASRYLVDQAKLDKIKSTLGTKALPALIIIWGAGGDKHKSAFHDGQHRAIALKMLGITRIPVYQVWDKEYFRK